MKNIFFFFALLLCSLQLRSQTDQPTYGYNYQAIIRNNNGMTVVNTPVQLRFRILTTSNQNLYEETHNATTDPFGRVAMVVGTGTPAGSARFDTLNWAARKHFLDVAVKIGGAANWVDLGNEEVVHQAFAKGDKDWKNVGDTVLISDGRRIGIGINNPKHDLSVAKGAAFGSRILPGLNGTENGFSLVHFKNGTDNQGGIIRASKGDDDEANAPLIYQGKRHVFQGGDMMLDKDWPNLTFQNNAGKAYYWEMSGGESFYLFDPSLSKYRLYFHPNGKAGIGTTNPQADFDVNGTLFVRNQRIFDGNNTLISFDGPTGTTWQNSIFLFDNNGPLGVSKVSIVVDANGTGGIQAEQIVASMKNFRMQHPNNPDQEIWYACIEGPEAAVYERGTVELVNGMATITLSEHFQAVMNSNTMTVQVTPLSPDSEGLSVYEKSENGFKIKELRHGAGIYRVDWEAKAVRKGYENYQVVRRSNANTIPIPSNGSEAPSILGH